MTTGDALTFLMACGFVVWFVVSAFRFLRLTWRRFWGRFQPGTRIDFRLADVPLSSEQWKRFCSLAHARGISQKRLLADMVVFYFEKIVK